VKFGPRKERESFWPSDHDRGKLKKIGSRVHMRGNWILFMRDFKGSSLRSVTAQSSSANADFKTPISCPLGPLTSGVIEFIVSPQRFRLCQTPKWKRRLLARPERVGHNF
jgi:hypothetical protein